MNGTAKELFQSDCPLLNCHWTSDPLPTPDGAREARRKHVSEHTHGDLVAYTCASHTDVARFEQDPTPAPVPPAREPEPAIPEEAPGRAEDPA